MFMSAMEHLSTDIDHQVVARWPQLSSSFIFGILNASPDCIKVLELDGTLSFMNVNGMCAMEIADFCMVEGKPWPSLWPEESHATLWKAVRDAGKGCSSRFEAFCPTALGNARWWEVSVAPITDDEGRISNILASSRDITERVLAVQQLESANAALQANVEKAQKLNKENEALTGEIDHRVKNSFGMIASLLRLQANSSANEETRDALNTATRRIDTLAKVHDQLHLNAATEDVYLPNYVDSLLEGLVHSIGVDLTWNRKEVADVSLPSKRAVALGLIIAELVANAVKHGGKEDGCKVELSLSVEADNLVLVVSDDGNGLPSGFESNRCSGLGMKVCNGYASQLGGELECANRESGGAQFTLRLPISL